MAPSQAWPRGQPRDPWLLVGGALPPARLEAWWRSRTPWERRHLHVLAWLVVGFLLHSLLYAVFFVEDAGISFAYARNVVQGEGPVPWPGAEPVEGYSNPLWTFLLAGLQLLGIAPWIAARVLGALLGAACLPLAWWLVRRARPGRDDLVPLAAPAWLAASSTWVIWCASGLENALFGFLVAAGTALLLVEAGRPPRPLPWSALCFAGVALTRPEGVLYGGIAGLGWLAFQVRRLGWRRAIGPVSRWAAVALLPLVLYECWRLAVFAWPLPNTFYAKLEGERRFRPWNWEVRGWKYAVAYARATWLAWALPLLPVGMLGLRTRRRWLVLGLSLVGAPLLAWDGRLDGALELPPRYHFAGMIALQRGWEPARTVFVLLATALLLVATPRDAGAAARRLLLGMLAAGLCFVVVSGGDWMKQWRWFSLVAVPIACLVALGVGGMLEALPGRAGRVVAAGLLLALLVPYTWQSAWSAPEPETTVSDVRLRVDHMREVQRKLHLDHVVLLDVDMGAHLWFTDWEIVDIAGLVDVPMSRHRFERPFLEQYLFEERRPDFAHVHAAWANRSRIPRIAAFKEGYVEIPGYPSSPTAFHIGNHVRRDLLARPAWEGPGRPRRLLGDGLVLEGWDLPGEVAPAGGRFHLDLAMSSGGRGAGLRALVVLLAEGGERFLVEAPLGWDWLPPPDWKPGEVVHTPLDLPLPAGVTPGRYRLGLLLVDAPSGEPITPEGREGADPVAWLEEGLEVVPPEVAEARARAGLRAALELAGGGDCDAALARWRAARAAVGCDPDAEVARSGAVPSALARCLAHRAGKAPDRAEQVELLARARRWNHRLEEVVRPARALAAGLVAEGDRAAAAGDDAAAYAAWRDALRLDPRLSHVRRRAEAVRDRLLGLAEGG